MGLYLGCGIDFEEIKEFGICVNPVDDAVTLAAFLALLMDDGCVIRQSQSKSQIRYM